jgi:3-methylfumaryl-CoA hydratase
VTIEQQIEYWTGRTTESTATISAEKAAMLANSIGIEKPGHLLPPLWHWMYHLDAVAPPDIGIDGHAKLGVLMPDLPAKRRMFAGSKVLCHRPIPISSEVCKKQTISKIEKKEGKSGTLYLVTVDIDLSDSQGSLITEKQSIVYLQSEGGPRADRDMSKSLTQPDHTTNFAADEVLLFRFSALTFNAHRIHYDKEYAVHEEGYPERVVHAPLNAIMLAHYAALWLNAPLTAFSFRAEAPVFLGEKTQLEGRKQSDGHLKLVVRTPDGQIGLSASASC